MRKIKILYDFLRLWVMWGDRKEAWQDANSINDPNFQEELEEISNKLDQVLLEKNPNFKEVCLEISQRLSNLPYDNGDISDIGNEIGIVLGKHIQDGSFGWEREDLNFGIKHGISIANGTH